MIGTRGALRALKKIPHVALAAIMFLPFLICFVYAFGESGDLLTGGFMPTRFYLGNIAAVITKNKYFYAGLQNSMLTTIPTVAVLGVITPMAAYVLARFHTRPLKLIYSLLLASVLLPFQSIMLPLYIGLKNTHLLNTPLGFILTKVGFTIAFDVTIITGFVKGIPAALEEAATIDGAGRAKAFWVVIFPLLQPVNITVLVLNVLTVWNDFNIALIVLQRTAVRTLPLAQYFYFSEGYIDLNKAFAFALLSMLPLIILYLFTQRYIVDGITAGSVKA